jgi:hypothetical protein
MKYVRSIRRAFLGNLYGEGGNAHPVAATLEDAEKTFYINTRHTCVSIYIYIELEFLVVQQ